MATPVRRITIFSGLFHPVNRDILRKLLITTLCMIVMPLGTFFLMERWLMPTFFASVKYHLMWSGFASIFMVNVVSALYIWSSFREDADRQDRPQQRKID
mmetsp:Transcript_9480/g.35499  ORF Transcript_9480/g.35499 Transcript_9480/m.35499 type:complete len:100 (-) Transcript_9480:49-348(-)